MVTKAGTELQIRCKKQCGFVVDTEYYLAHTRFQPGLCARCNAPVEVVLAYTDTLVSDYGVETSPRARRPGAVLPHDQLEANK